jgi:hypothetical protein
MALINRSGTITTGGTAQTLMAADTTRNGFSVQNLSTGDLWINELGGTAAASQPAIKITSGSLYETPRGMPCEYAVSIFGATTGQAFMSRSW